MNEKNTFIMYADAIQYTEGLSFEQMGQLYYAQLQYANGIEPSIEDPEVKGVFRVLKHFMDVEAEKYENKCRQLRANASRPKQKQANATKSNQMHADASKSNQIGSDNDNDNVNDNDIKEKERKKEKVKHKYGTFGHVLLADDEVQKLEADFGKVETAEAINYLDEYIERKGYKTKSHYLAIRKWVFDAIKEDKLKKRELEEREKRLTGKEKPKDGIKRNNDLDQWLQQRTAERLNGIS